MKPTSRPATRIEKGKPAAVAAISGPHPAVVGLLAWWIPGAGHFVVGQIRKALVFFVVLDAMIAIGLGFGGRLFPVQPADPLVLLAALAEWAIALPRAAAALVNLGAGNVVSVTYEYGNTFLIVSGLLNALVLLDALDLATGRKKR